MRSADVAWSVGVEGMERAASNPSPWWVVWRLHRAALAAVTVAVLALGAVAAGIEWATRAQLQATALDTGEPEGGMYHFTDFAPGLLLYALVIAPSLAGAVTGARVWAREFERGTAVVLFGQGVTRRRWWAVTVTLLGAAPATLFAALGVLMDALPLAGPGRTLQPSTFLGSGPVLGGYYFLAFGIAVLVGVLSRNTAATIVITLLLSGAAMVMISLWARPHYLPPVETTIPIELLGTDIRPTQDMPVHPDLTLGYWYVAADGATVDDRLPMEQCLAPATADPSWTEQDTVNFQREIGIVAQSVAFQPIERWPLFQLVESALVSALGLLIAAVAVRPLRRRAR